MHTRIGMLLASLAVVGLARPAGADEFQLTILHSNDGETRLVNAGGSQAQYGGVDRFATLARRLRAEAGNCGRMGGSLLISSGDNFLAGAQFNASLSLPSNDRFYDTVALDLIGCNASAIGNHEFDFGPDVTARFIRGFGVANRAPAFLSANLDVSGEPSLASLARQRRIAACTTIVQCGRRIGIVGATTPLLPAISSPRNVVTRADVVGAIQAEVDQLLASRADIVILTSQLGGVDVAISGGGSDLLNSPAPHAGPLVPRDSALASIT